MVTRNYSRLPFPLLYDLDSRKRCFISERLGTNNVNWVLRTAPRDPMKLAELGTLSEVVRSIQISESEDRWIFKLSGDGNFCVCLLRRLIDTVCCHRLSILRYGLSLCL